MIIDEDVEERMGRGRPWAEYMTRIMKDMNGEKCEDIKEL